MAQKVPTQAELIWNEQLKLNNAIFFTLSEVMSDNAVLDMSHILTQAETLKQYHLTYKTM